MIYSFIKYAKAQGSHARSRVKRLLRSPEKITSLQELSAYVPGSHVVYGAGKLWEELAVSESTEACWQFSKGKGNKKINAYTRQYVPVFSQDTTIRQLCEEDEGDVSHGHFRLARLPRTLGYGKGSLYNDPSTRVIV
jgi:hypothetical protein